MKTKVSRAAARYLLTEIREREAKMVEHLRGRHPEYPDWQVNDLASARTLHELVGVLSYYADRPARALREPK